MQKKPDKYQVIFATILAPVNRLSVFVLACWPSYIKAAGNFKLETGCVYLGVVVMNHAAPHASLGTLQNQAGCKVSQVLDCLEQTSPVRLADTKQQEKECVNNASRITLDIKTF